MADLEDLDEEKPIVHGPLCPVNRPLPKSDKKASWEDDDAASKPRPVHRLKPGQVCIWTLPPYAPPLPYQHPTAPTETEPEPEVEPKASPSPSSGSKSPITGSPSLPASHPSGSTNASSSPSQSSMLTPSSSAPSPHRERIMGKIPTSWRVPSGSVQEVLLGVSAIASLNIAPDSPPSGPNYTEKTLITDLWDPYKYELVRCTLERGPNRPLGMVVKNVAPNVFKVVGVMKDEAADKAGIQVGMYLLTLGGRTIKSEEHYNGIEGSIRQFFRLCVVKKRPKDWRPNTFPLPSFVQRRPGFEYHLCRLNPSDGTQVGIGVKQRGETVNAMQVLAGSAGEKAGVKAGDRVASIDEMRVNSQDVCKNLVQLCSGNAFDMIVERQVAGGAPSLPSSQPSESAKSQDAQNLVKKMGDLFGDKIKESKQSVKTKSQPPKSTPKPSTSKR